ncbi:MAG: hypothetical protein DLM58_12790 [Pseudonocardiales bacterium]|nr:MAG: hypothetical protein DLM58_12790 [Pseudonocardiales bacterium]
MRLAAVAAELNDRPRKTLGWITPAALIRKAPHDRSRSLRPDPCRSGRRRAPRQPGFSRPSAPTDSASGTTRRAMQDSRPRATGRSRLSDSVRRERPKEDLYQVRRAATAGSQPGRIPSRQRPGPGDGRPLSRRRRKSDPARPEVHARSGRTQASTGPAQGPPRP